MISTHLSNSQGGGNKRGRGAKVEKLINVEEGINVDRLPKVVKSINKINEEGGNFSRDYYTWRREFVCGGGQNLKKQSAKPLVY